MCRLLPHTAREPASITGMGDQLESWTDFNVAMLGATAALAGLVIVAASVNIGEIVKARSLTARLAAGISALVLAIIGAGLCLVPEISAAWFGGLILVAALGAGVFQIVATREIFVNSDPEARAKVAKSALGFFPVLAYAAAGILAVVGSPAALYVVAAGCVLAIIAAIIVSWVALVEVLR